MCVFLPQVLGGRYMYMNYIFFHLYLKVLLATGLQVIALNLYLISQENLSFFLIRHAQESDDD